MSEETRAVEPNFTWRDVDMLRRLTQFHRVEVEITGPYGETRRYEALTDLADRIAALLPPRP